MTRQTAAVVAGGVLLIGGMITAAIVTTTDSPTATQAGLLAPNALAEDQTLAEGQYVGPCSIVTPPEPDPCEAAQGTLRYAFWGELVNADQFKKWKRSAPLDYNRLLSVMLAPRCSTPATPQPQIMVTKMGAALANVVHAYACAKGTEAITMPTPNPVVSGSDQTPPSAPGPITVTPGG